MRFLLERKKNISEIHQSQHQIGISIKARPRKRIKLKYIQAFRYTCGIQSQVGAQNKTKTNNNHNVVILSQNGYWVPQLSTP